MRSDWLDAFVVFTEHMNLTHAARALSLSQPALHAQLLRLSEEVGAPLYHRQGKLLVLTRDGEEVARFGRQARRQRQIFLEELREGGRQSPVRFAAGQGAYLYLLGEALRRFRERRGLALHLQVLGQEACLEAIRSGRCELGVTVMEAAPDWPELHSELLGSFEPVAVMPPTHALAGRARVQVQELARCELIAPPRGRPWREQLMRSLEGTGARVRVEASGWPLMMHFAALGLGVAVVNGCCVLPPGVVGVPVEGLPATHYRVVHREGTLSPAVEALKASLLADQKASTVTGQ